MNSLKNSIGIRLIIICFLTGTLLIPVVIVQDLISERENRRDSVSQEISLKWGGEQTITGPLISIPYWQTFRNGNEIEQNTGYAHFLPENLNIEGVIIPEIRYRGIYQTVVYNTVLELSGNFSSIDLHGLGVPAEDFVLEDALLSVGITDMNGIKEFVTIQLENHEYLADPGIPADDVLASGISISPDLESGRVYDFKIKLNLNGSSGLLFSPAGKQTDVQLTSVWANPGFTGHFLPSDREVTESGFRAEWNVLHLNRNFPQQWLGAKPEVSNTTFGVNLLLPVDEYQKTMRSAKYAIMFISLTFITFFMFELLSSHVIHPLQYLMVGVALIIFYTLLLSISEYIVFGLAYLVASSAVIMLVTIYSYNILGERSKAGVIFGVLTLLYSFLYILLQIQDYALLMGSIGLFVVLAIVMYLTRKINWFKIMSSPDK